MQQRRRRRLFVPIIYSMHFVIHEEKKNTRARIIIIILVGSSVCARSAMSPYIRTRTHTLTHNSPGTILRGKKNILTELFAHLPQVFVSHSPSLQHSFSPDYIHLASTMTCSRFSLSLSLHTARTTAVCVCVALQKTV